MKAAPQRLHTYVAGLALALLLAGAAGAQLPDLQDPKVQYELGLAQLSGPGGAKTGAGILLAKLTNR